MSSCVDHRATRVRHSDPPPDGLDRVAHDLTALLRCPPWRPAELARKAARVLERSAELGRLKDDALEAKRRELADRFRLRAHPDDSTVIESMAAVAETASRVLGLRPRRVQLMGALGLLEGHLIEMATGEGKSLTACLAAALFGWSGRPCHVLTVNDYLAARDADEMRAYYIACGLTVSSVGDEMEGDERREAYQASVVYTTAGNLLADFLRDRLQLGPLVDADRRLIRAMAGSRAAAPAGVVLRGIDTVLVDEADSVLIDEAVTPLLISVPSDDPSRIKAARQAVAIAEKLKAGEDYSVDEQHHEVELLDPGIDKIDAAAAGLGGVWKGALRRQEIITQVLHAREFHRRGQQYVVHEGKIVIVDDFTGRMMPDRTWSHGMHQAIEALEQVEVTSPTQTLTRLSFQRFFRMFHRVCGMSGTVREVRSELWHIYELPVVPIPTFAKSRRAILPDRVFPDEPRKLAAIVEDVARWHAAGRPVLCGTRRVKASEQLAELLTARGIPFKLLNATKHREEAAIIAEAGQKGMVTIATNMAGRGTDIKLGPGVRDLGGLHVVVAERNESTRVDRQLVGRAARQGDPGSAQAYVCPDDELIVRFTRPLMREALRTALAARLPGGAMLAQAVVRSAQRRAQDLAYAQRVGVMRQDEWLEDALSFAAPLDGGGQ